MQLSALDATGKPVAVTWTLSPNVGRIEGGWSQGDNIYTAPATVSGAVSITATATSVSNPALTGTAVVQVTPSANIAIQPAEASVKPGAALALTAAAIAGDKAEIRWVVYPTGAGGIVFDPDDPAKATYTAPSSIPKEGNQAHVVAYLVDGQAAGLGFASITLTS